MTTGLWQRLALLFIAIGLACGPGTPAVEGPAASATATPSAAAPLENAPPMPSLRTGALRPREHPEVLKGKVSAHAELGDVQLFEIELPSLRREAFDPTMRAGLEADGSLAFVRPDLQSGELLVYARRPRAQSGAIAGALYTSAEIGSKTAEPGLRARFSADAPKGPKDAKLEGRWMQALARHLQGDWTTQGAWQSFAAERLERSPKAPRPTAAARRADEVGFLMDTMTGMSSVHETLQHDRALLLRTLDERRTIDIAQLSPPPLAAHPFEQMLSKLGVAPPDEPLARAVPAEFYYLRFATIADFFALADEIDAWGTQAARILDGRADERALVERYEAELGLSRGALARAFGTKVVAEMAIVGSDPYLREGTDLTVLFRLESDLLFEAGIAAALEKHARAHGPLETDKYVHAGVEVSLRRSADGAVHQHRAKVGDIALVSNSRVAMARVIEAALGKRARLADEHDFRYMLARDREQQAQVIGFAGDRFVAEVIGPRQKVLEVRRLLASAELVAPGWASLVYGWIHGKSPAHVDALVRAKLLDRSELRHRDGSAIDWEPGGEARSKWGSPAALTPLIDLPAPTKVSASERDAYRWFVDRYQRQWSTYVDPVMLRLKLVREGESLRRIEARLRVLPLIDGTEYRSIARDVGQARVVPPPPAAGLRVLLGVGREAELRDELSGSSRELFGRPLSIDWLGGWASFGLADDPRAAIALDRLGVAPGRPRTADERAPDRDGDLFSALRALPAYAAFEVRSTAAASVALIAARRMAEEAVPGGIVYEELRHRDVPIVRVRIRESDDDEELSLYYALYDRVLYLSLHQGTIARLIDERLDGRGPRAAPQDDAQASQLVVDLGAERQSPLYTIMAWLLEEGARRASERSRADAEALLRGAPESAKDEAAFRRLALANFGAVPLTPDGALFELAPDGVRDPRRGTAHAPSWPALPVPGSPAEKLLSAVAAFRSGLAFDDEGRAPDGEPMRSLRVDAQLSLR